MSLFVIYYLPPSPEQPLLLLCGESSQIYYFFVRVTRLFPFSKFLGGDRKEHAVGALLDFTHLFLERNLYR
jgi:hypothetical protein